MAKVPNGVETLPKISIAWNEKALKVKVNVNLNKIVKWWKKTINYNLQIQSVENLTKSSSKWWKQKAPSRTMIRSSNKCDTK